VTTANGHHGSGGQAGGGTRSRSGSMKMTILSLKRAVVEGSAGGCVGAAVSYTGLPTTDAANGRGGSQNDLLADSSSTGSSSNASRSPPRGGISETSSPTRNGHVFTLSNGTGNSKGDETKSPSCIA